MSLSLLLGLELSKLSELSELSDAHQLSELSDCRTCGRQWETVEEHGTVELLSESLSDPCRTLSDTVGLSDCRIVGLSDHCRITVGLYCRTVGPGLSVMPFWP